MGLTFYIIYTIIIIVNEKEKKLMLIDVGDRKYRNISSDEDFLRIVEEKISWEFAEELRKRLNGVQEYINELKEDSDSDFSYIEQENEYLRNLIDDVNSMIQSYIYPIERGQRLYRDKTIKFLNEIIKYLDNT